jgi:uncharacterized protein
MMTGDRWITLRKALEPVRDGAIAVSGGVDSTTLAAFAHDLLGANGVRMVHAISPAVPAAATARVRDHAARLGWSLSEVDAGEFNDPRYRANPVNRCFYCKSNLYGTLRRVCDGVIMSGTNTNDLGDYRPGLQAATDNDVRHPYLEAGMDKAAVRALARELNLDDLSELPASPCLSSRVETGIAIQAPLLALIDTIETWLLETLGAETVRCRVRQQGMVIELDPTALEALSSDQRRSIVDGAAARMPEDVAMAVDFAPYQRGSAFVGAPKTPAA